MEAVTIRNLRKRYGATAAVDDISFTIHQGEVFGMLGPNGAGKTTTVEIIEGLRVADSGDVSVLGLDVEKSAEKIKARIGVQLQTTALYPLLTVREVIDLFRSFFPSPVEEADYLIDLVDLEEKENTRSKNLSGGQQQRLSMALSLVNRPEILFLDEPTTGLDPQARRKMWDVIQQVNQGGTTVFLTTHYMEEAERLCDRVAIIDQGKIIALDTPEQLIDIHFKESCIEFELRGDEMDELDRLLERLGELSGVSSVGYDQERVCLYSTVVPQALAALTAYGEAHSLALDDLHVRRATLEDVFLKLTGRRIRE
jgi:ABC-2 type transport system ATP-binding protein